VVLFKDLPDEVQEAVSIKMQEKVASSSINTTVEDIT
jgi:hypothetical protein